CIAVVRVTTKQLSGQLTVVASSVAPSSYVLAEAVEAAAPSRQTARATPRGMRFMSPFNTSRGRKVRFATRRADGRRPDPAVCPAFLQSRDVDGLGALVALLLFVVDLRALGERAVAVAGDAAVVDEEVATAVIRRDEAEALVVAEPLHRSRCHCVPRGASMPAGAAGGVPSSTSARSVGGKLTGSGVPAASIDRPALSAQEHAGVGDRIHVARRRYPRQLERVPDIAGHDVYVEVEDRLPRRRPTRVDEVDAVGAKALSR